MEWNLIFYVQLCPKFLAFERSNVLYLLFYLLLTVLQENVKRENLIGNFAMKLSKDSRLTIEALRLCND